MRRIVIIDNVITPQGAVQGTIVFRIDVPATMAPYAASASATSAVPDATPAELAALQAGTLREVVASGDLPASTPTALIEAQLLATLNELQAQQAAQAPAKRYTTGVYDDTTQTWSNMPA